MNTSGLLSTAVTLETMFGAQFEGVLAAGTKKINDELSAGGTDAEIATSATLERKMIFAGLNKVLGATATK